MRKKRKNNGPEYDHKVVLAPFNEQLAPEKRTAKVIELSELITRIATHIICYTIVYHQDLLNDERLSIAHAFLQRMTTTHICNHKLTAEGLVYNYQGESFELHEEYKTMTLTRTVYEHLAMFYYLYEMPQTEDEKEQAWKDWKNNSISKRLPYNQAWKYLFNNEEMKQLYSQLSIHCHPIYQGLQQYQNQSLSDQGNDAIPLYLSTSLLAYLCRLFLKQIPNGRDIIRKEFNEYERFVFDTLAQK